MKTARRFLRPLLSLVIAVTLCGQTAPDPARSDERILFAEIPSVFGASKFEQKISEAPSSVTIVTAEEIRDLGYRTLGEVLRGTRSFYTSYDRNYEYAGTRGFSRSGDFNTRILILIDGHRLNEIIYNYGPIGTEFPVDLALVDRIEIIRGPSSSLYGTSAFFGVINVITRNGADMNGAMTTILGGSRGTNQQQVTWGGRLESGTEVVASATRYGSEGSREEAAGADRDRAHRLFSRLSRGPFTLTLGHSSREKHIPTGAYGSIPGDSRTRTLDEFTLVDAAYNKSVRGTDVSIRAFWDRAFYSGFWAYEDSVMRDRGRGERFGTATELRRKVGRHSLVGGVELVRNYREDQDASSTGTDGSTTVILDSDHGSTGWGLFLQDDVALTRVLRASLGIRHDHHQSFGSTNNPRLALIFAPREGMTFKFLAGQAFRAPNPYELLYSDGVSQKPNPSLQPEKVRTYELVAERFSGRNLYVTAVLFQYKADHLVMLQTDDDGLLIFRNIGRASAKGGELEVQGTFRGVGGRLSYTYQEAAEQSGEPLTNSPKHLVKSAFQIPLIPRSLRLGVETLGVAKRATLSGVSLDPFVISNWTLRYPFGRWEARLSAYNAFNRSYSDPASEEFTQDEIRQDGRTWLLGLGYTVRH